MVGFEKKKLPVLRTEILTDDHQKLILGPVRCECPSWRSRMFDANDASRKCSETYSNDKILTLLPPANEVCEGYVFTGVCLSTWGGHAWFYLGGHAWFYSGGHAWFYLGGHAWFYSGGAAWFYSGGMHGFSGGACMVFSVFSDTMRYGQWAGCTHPTGMHSCYFVQFPRLKNRQHELRA